ncbi:C4-type zinc ribbon domain-containing protein [Microlunatus panaciterrae]|uniref:Nucleic acid-binding Zn-ribbon protein n=1 Tax=Microlunatus panaciterrae TaxID=400768 RepID=A0ABS2RFX5_9ACTN|nr:C4-type zinc ribbon domain-containing protein [Microlunatus panaciterrae]MBM7797901.1 putative nucleic acid-binding Zn-ribbon protein [Microlunatus panaciterrae]
MDLQAVDTALNQLQHRRRTLPEHALIAELQNERNQRAESLVAAETIVSDLEREQEKAEADLQPVRDRLLRDEHRIADGTVADPKALAGLIEEVEHLTRRISDLEDAELELMEQLDSANASAAQLRGEVAALDGRLAELQAKRDQQLAELDADAAERQVERDDLAPQVNPDLITLYDKIRSTHGGVGAAELRQRRCTGCRLEINAAELREFAAAAEDEVLRCEECGRILVRTAESGL